MTIIASVTDPTTATHRPVWRAAAVSGALAAAATASVAVLADLAGVSVEVDGKPIPASGFATLTLMAVAIGYVLAVALNRWASRPRHAFTVTTVALTAASFVPDLVFPMSVATRLVLITAHVVAACIVIPAIAACLEEKR